MPIVSNNSKRVLIREVANATYVIAGNNTVSNVTIGTETITGGTITSILWSTDATITVARGANTILNLRNQGKWDLRAVGAVLSESPAASVVINVGATANAVVIVEITKVT